MPHFLATHYAEFQAPVSTGGVFYAAWPRDASSRDLRAINGMLGLTLEWWADKAAPVSEAALRTESWLAASPTAAPKEEGEPVGEIVLFGGDLKEVSWRKGKMPEPGTKLYTRPIAAVTQGDAK